MKKFKKQEKPKTGRDKNRPQKLRQVINSLKSLYSQITGHRPNLPYKGYIWLAGLASHIYTRFIFMGETWRK